MGIQRKILFKIFVPLFMILSGCGDEEIDNFGASRQTVDNPNYLELLKTYKNTNTNKDSSILLNYNLGWSKNQVENYTDSLINARSLLPKKRYRVIAFNEISNRLDTFKLWLNYMYKFKYGANQVGLLGYEFTDSKLSHLQLIVTDQEYINSSYIPSTNYITIKNLLEEKYGKPLFATNIYDKYRKEGSFELFCWLSGNKEIQLKQFMNICKITYTDLTVALNQEEYTIESRTNEIKQKIQSDSIEKVNKTIKEKEDAKEDKKTIKNF